MDEKSINALMNSYGMDPALLNGQGGSLNINWTNLFGGLVFGVIGLYAFNYGRKERAWKPLAIGLFLMVFPYFVPNTFLLYGVGIGVSSLLYFWRD